MEEKKTILLVEDDDVVRDMIKGALERQYNVIAAAKCSEARALAGNHIDLAIVDYNLPDGDGFDVLNVVRDGNPGLPVILITAYSTENLTIRALRSGATDYMKKPLNFACLRGKLSGILEGKGNGEPPETVESREVFVMDCTAAFMEENYWEDLTRDQLSERVRMDRHQFSRAFNERFGQNVRSYVNKIRVGKAADLLRKSPDLGVAQIAAMVGYGSTFHFERAFKRAYGMTPGEYRRSRVG